MTTPANDPDSQRIAEYLSERDFAQYDHSLQKLLDGDYDQVLRVLTLEESGVLRAFATTVDQAVDNLDTASPLNRIALEQTILLGGVLTKLLPLAEYGLEQFKSRQKGKRRSTIKQGNTIAEYHCLKIAIELWAENPGLRIGDVARRCQRRIENRFHINKPLTTYKDWIKAAHQAGVLVMPPDAQRPGASLTP